VVVRLPGRTSSGHGTRWSADDADDARARRPRHGSWRSRWSRTVAVDASLSASATAAAVSAAAPGPVARGRSAATAGPVVSGLMPGNAHPGP
jgi:hypothetical protein